MALTGASERIVTGTIPGRGPVAVRVVGSRIGEVTTIKTASSGTLIPGLLDLQVNGYGGIDLNDGAVTPDTVVALIRALWEVGVTGFCPTFVTAPVEQLSPGCARWQRCWKAIPTWPAVCSESISKARGSRSRTERAGRTPPST